MQYTEGRIGRIFVIRVDHGEDLLSAVRDFIAAKEIGSGIVHFIGALAEGQIVTGPEKMVLPPDPRFISFSDGWEVMGTATISPGRSGPHIHYHCSVGKGEAALTGCLRHSAPAYIIVEAVILEFLGVSTRRDQDSRTGLELPVHGERLP